MTKWARSSYEFAKHRKGSGKPAAWNLYDQIYASPPGKERQRGRGKASKRPVVAWRSADQGRRP